MSGHCISAGSLTGGILFFVLDFLGCLKIQSGLKMIGLG